MADNRNTLKLSDVDRTLSAQTAIVEWQTSLQQACYDAIDADDVKEIVRNQVKKAKEGDQNAIKFVMGHLLGSQRPIQINQTQVITDVAGAARIASRNRDAG